MSHNINLTGGKASIFTIGKPPWHGLGETFDINTWLTPKEALEHSGCAFEVDTFPLLTSEVVVDNKVLIKGGLKAEHQGVYRKDNGIKLGEIGPNTHLYQNKDAFEWFAPFVENKSIKFESAGALGKGEKVWALARLVGKTSEIGQGDTIEKFLLLSNSHDGSMAVRVGFTPIRVVCANTMAMAHNSSKSRLIRVRHGKDVKDRVDEMRLIINAVDASFESTIEQYRLLCKRKNINQNDLKRYVTLVFGDDVPEDKLSTRTKNVIKQVTVLFDTAYGNNLASVRGSWWAAYNGINQYLNYTAGNNTSTRLNSLWFGANAKLNDKSLELALSLSA